VRKHKQPNVSIQNPQCTTRHSSSCLNLFFKSDPPAKCNPNHARCRSALMKRAPERSRRAKDRDHSGVKTAPRRVPSLPHRRPLTGKDGGGTRTPQRVSKITTPRSTAHYQMSYVSTTNFTNQAIPASSCMPTTHRTITT